MSANLSITIGQYSDRGHKEENQDFYGAVLPKEPQLSNKGITVAIADGVSSSISGREAAESCVKSFLADYYSTPDSWTVKTSAHKILTAINSWLYSKGQRYSDMRKGMFTTFSAFIMKSTTGHIFHVGDTRIYRLQDKTLECLTTDHRRQIQENDYLSRAIGIDLHLEIDYRSVDLEAGDIFVLTTDGVHDFVPDKDVAQIITSKNGNLDEAAKQVVHSALENGSTDNITCQIIRIDNLPLKTANEVYTELTRLPFPPDLEPGMILDGYKIEREIHASKRTQVYKAVDTDTGKPVVIKTPSVNFEDEPTYIDNFIREEWIGKRIHHSRVLKIVEQTRPRKFLYYVTEYIDGQTLRDWMNVHSRPDITQVRLIVEQIASGLRAFHRLEMIHQDIKPENIMLDAKGMVKIIDFGSTKIAGIAEITTPIQRLNLLGTRNYTAPEYLLGQPGTNRSDIFSLGVISYELLTGKLPYGDAFQKELKPAQIEKLKYHPSYHYNAMIPAWLDKTIEKAVKLNPKLRYELLSEFITDISKPNEAFLREKPVPLMEKNPLKFWQFFSLVLVLINLLLLYLLHTS